MPTAKIFILKNTRLRKRDQLFCWSIVNMERIDSQVLGDCLLSIWGCIKDQHGGIDNRWAPFHVHSTMKGWLPFLSMSIVDPLPTGIGCSTISEQSTGLQLVAVKVSIIRVVMLMFHQDDDFTCWQKSQHLIFGCQCLGLLHIQRLQLGKQKRWLATSQCEQP